MCTRSALIPSVLLLALAGAAAGVRADLWGYVDERGVAHFASEPLDHRYQLFLRMAAGSAPAPGQSPPIEALPPAASRPTTTAVGAVEPLAPRLRAFFEQSPAVMRAEPLLRGAAERFNLDLALLKALVLAESGFDPQAVSPKGAIGLMQLMPATAQRYAFQGEAREALAGRLTDPQLNVTLGARHLRELINRYEGRIELALAAYNAGEGAVQRAGDAIPAIPETRHYVRQVMQVYAAMRTPAPVVTSVPPTASAAEPPAVPLIHHPPRAASGWDATRGGAFGRRNMPVPAGADLLPAQAVDAVVRPAPGRANAPVTEAALD
jgi:uncharacterized coiled-coil protein SlyX